MRIIILVALLALVACTQNRESEQALDQCMRVQLFQACLKLLPAGPTTVHYNDWDEVVEACGAQAARASYRIRSQIKLECRAE